MVSRSGRYTGWASAQEEATVVQLPTLRRLRLSTRNLGHAWARALMSLISSICLG